MWSGNLDEVVWEFGAGGLEIWSRWSGNWMMWSGNLDEVVVNHRTAKKTRQKLLNVGLILWSNFVR
jgi:hypothetical protein